MCTTNEETSLVDGGSSSGGSALPQMKNDDDFFCSLVDFIPARYYFDQETAKEIRNKIQEGTEQALLSNGHKGNAMLKMGQVGKHRYAKFNPQINKSVMQILKEVDEEERGIRGKKNKKIKKDRLNLLSKQGGTLHSEALDKASSIEALQQNLRAKIEKMKSGRDLDQIRARREIQKLRQQTQKQRKGTGNQIKHGRPVEEPTEDGGASPSSICSSGSKPVYNSEGKMVFSKFDFSNSGSGTVDSPIGNNRALKKMANVKGLKGYKKQLEFIEEKQKKLDELKKSDPEKATEIEEKSAWLDALDRSKGIKKKDNAELLKKTIKRREQAKDKSKKKWAARQETVRKSQEERQNKRKANLQARRETKISNKLKKMSKKGRVINMPGF